MSPNADLKKVKSFIINDRDAMVYLVNKSEWDVIVTANNWTKIVYRFSRFQFKTGRTFPNTQDLVADALCSIFEDMEIGYEIRIAPGGFRLHSKRDIIVKDIERAMFIDLRSQP
jgi:hypothetical protein